MKDNRKIIQVLAILTLIFAIVGGTLAYWQWTTNTEQKTNVVFTITQDFSCAADGGGNITQADVKLAPTSCTDATRAIKRKVTVTPTLDRDNLTVILDLWLNVHELGEGLKKSNNFRYALTTSSNSCEDGTIISEGNFKGRKPGDKIRLITNDLHTITPTPEEYYLYIWLDAEETNDNTMNQRFNLSLGGVCDEVETLQGDGYALLTEDGTFDSYWQTGQTKYSLTFVRSETPIMAGSTYNGKTITEVYRDLETTEYYFLYDPDSGEPYTNVPWFSHYQSIHTIKFEDTTRPISTAGWFANTGFKVEQGTGEIKAKVELNKLDMSQVKDTSAMFFNAATELIDFSNWDTSNVRNMTGIFSSMHIPELNVSRFDTSNVTNMSAAFNATGMYSYEDSPIVVDLSTWDVSKVTDMSHMFGGDSNIESVGDISNWNVSNVENMQGMFSMGLQNIPDISSWDTSNVTDMSGMFVSAQINNLDLSSWNTSKVTNMREMFQWAQIQNLDILDWDTSNVIDMSYMFNETYLSEILDLSHWNVKNVTQYDYFYSKPYDPFDDPQQYVISPIFGIN